MPRPIFEIYKRGGTINDLMETPFFSEIRRWQKSYGYLTKPMKTKNLILPCPHRDHFDCLYPLLLRHCPKPINKEAEKALSDERYVQGAFTLWTSLCGPSRSRVGRGMSGEEAGGCPAR